MTEQQLIDRARQGCEAAIRTLYERYAPRVYATVRRFADDDALAEDWAQEAWVAALRGLSRFRGAAQFSTWLHRIAINSALQGRRGRERRAGREAPLPEFLPGEDTANGGALLRFRLEDAMRELPPGMRQVLILHDVEGYTHEEVAESLGISPGTSKSQLFKARAKMRELLGGTAAAARGVEACHI
jgi:RNA polymerase sigma-70 factor (ECF subfamily)